MIRALVLALIVAAASTPALACADRAERTIGNVQRDISDGNVARTVGERLIGELRQAAEACRAGRAAQGEATINRIARTYNYR